MCVKVYIKRNAEAPSVLNPIIGSSRGHISNTEQMNDSQRYMRL